MDELTIEQKAQRYDEALEKAKDFYKGYKQRDNQLYTDDLESIFPELKESEDKNERIRKAISDILLIDSDEIREILDVNNLWMQDIDVWLKHQCEKGTNGNNEKTSNSAWSEKNSPYYDDICEILINLLYSENTDINKDVIQKDLDWLTNLYGILEQLKKSK